MGFLIILPCCFPAAPVAENAYAQEPATGDAPEDVWSDDYINMIFPWAPANDEILQFKQHHTTDDENSHDAARRGQFRSLRITKA